MNFNEKLLTRNLHVEKIKSPNNEKYKSGILDSNKRITEIEKSYADAYRDSERVYFR